jgi:hypothetical protein
MKNPYPYVNKCSVFLKTYPPFYLSFFFRVKYKKKIGNVGDLENDGGGVCALPSFTRKDCGTSGKAGPGGCSRCLSYIVIWFQYFPSGHVKRAFGAQNCRRRELWCPLSEKML